MGEGEIDRLLQAGIAAARAGRKEEARDLLMEVIARDDQVEAAWLWLSGVVDDLAGRQICLENVLTLDPDNDRARAGLQWLADRQATRSTHRAPAPEAGPRTILHTPPAAPAAPEPAQPPPSPAVQINPFGCPYCGGPARSDEPRCASCGRLTGIRQRKKQSGLSIGWLVALFLLLAATAWIEGALASRLVREEPLPAIVGDTWIQLLVGRVLIEPADASQATDGAVVESGDAVALANYALAGLCGVVALGLALRSRVAYFAALILCGLLIVAAVGGIVAGLSGWVPTLVRIGGIAFSVYWLVESSPAFEWEVRHYDADLDADLRTDLDYYNRGLRYRDMGMWAKAAVHWKVAGQLAPSKTAYHVALANAYAQMGEREAALAVAERAMAHEPDDAGLQAFRDSLTL
ncbi:MAG TPA: hypothetical protein VLC95_17800 [Anaerolineae bacterium]|nr:hypothetical protein [Anaerolineae bacterium]